MGPTPEIDAIVSALRTAQLPLILAGPSASRPAVHGLLTHFAARTGIPLLILDHPRGLSDPALGQAGKALARADAVLLFGKRQDYRLAYAQSPAIPDGVRLFQIDPEPGEIGRHRLVEIGAAASPLTAAQQLVAAAEAHAWPAVSTPWTEELEALRAAPLYEPVPRGAGGPLHPLHVFDALVDLLDRLGEEHVTVAIDGGEFGQWARARLRLRPPEHLVNEPSGAIGFAVPFAIGAKAAFPDRTAIAICGDGAFGFTAMELETAARCGLPVLVVVGTDGAWGTERHLQVERYGCTVATDLTTARYDLLAAGLGGHGEHVTQLDQLGPALSRALAAVERGQPALVNVSLLSIPSPAALPG